MKRADVLIIGSGVAGLFCALNLPRDKNILIITKDICENSDSFLAQGGICVLKDDSDYDSYFEDTLKAGHYENRRESVDIMIKSSPEIISDLVSYGVEFEKNGNEFVYTREGAHSTPRILFHKDITDRPELYNAADVFTSPIDNLQETFGLTPLEAMSCGVPQVVSDWDGYKDTVEDGITGFRIPVYWTDCQDDLASRDCFPVDRRLRRLLYQHLSVRSLSGRGLRCWRSSMRSSGSLQGSMSFRRIANPSISF